MAARLERNQRRNIETTQPSQTITDRTATALAGIIPRGVPNTSSAAARNISRTLPTRRQNLKSCQSIRAVIKRHPATRGIFAKNQTIFVLTTIDGAFDPPVASSGFSARRTQRRLITSSTCRPRNRAISNRTA